MSLNVLLTVSKMNNQHTSVTESLHTLPLVQASKQELEFQFKDLELECIRLCVHPGPNDTHSPSNVHMSVYICMNSVKDLQDTLFSLKTGAQSTCFLSFLSASLLLSREQELH